MKSETFLPPHDFSGLQFGSSRWEALGEIKLVPWLQDVHDIGVCSHHDGSAESKAGRRPGLNSEDLISGVLLSQVCLLK